MYAVAPEYDIIAVVTYGLLPNADVSLGSALRCMATPEPAAARKDKKSADWKLEHLDACESELIPWPPNIEKINGGFRFITDELSQLELTPAIHLNEVSELGE